MARKVALFTNEISAVRTKTNGGSAVTADSSTLTDANFPPAADATNGGTIDCRGLATIWIGVEFVGGSSPTIKLDPLIRDADAADGSRWKRLMPGDTPALVQPTLDGTGFVEIRCDGGFLYPRIDTVSNSPTTIRILARPGAALNTGRGFTTGNV